MQERSDARVIHRHGRYRPGEVPEVPRVRQGD